MPSAYAISAPAAEPRPGPTRMPSRLAYWHEVGDDQEVAREAHLADDVELVLGLRARGPRARRPGTARASPRCDLLAQPGLLGLALGHRELRHQVARGEHLRVVADPLGDHQRVVAGAGHLGVPQRAHLARPT